MRFFEWWPKYSIEKLPVTWQFFCVISFKNYAMGFVKLDELEKQEEKVNE
jgi:hypothetical protein